MLRFAVAPEGDRIRRAASIMASTAELRFLRRFKGGNGRSGMDRRVRSGTKLRSSAARRTAIARRFLQTL